MRRIALSLSHSYNLDALLCSDCLVFSFLWTFLEVFSNLNDWDSMILRSTSTGWFAGCNCQLLSLSSLLVLADAFTQQYIIKNIFYIRKLLWIVVLVLCILQIISYFLFKAGVLEEQLRMHLQCCLTLCSFWDLNLSVVTILWDYYSKNLVSRWKYKNVELHVDSPWFFADQFWFSCSQAWLLYFCKTT